MVDIKNLADIISDGYAEYWTNLGIIMMEQIKKSGANSLNLAMMAGMLQANSEVIKSAIQERGDISPEDFDRMDKLIKSFVRKTSKDLIDGLNRLR